MSPWRARRFPPAALLLVGAALLALPLAAQVEEEDLEETELATAPPQSSEPSAAELAAVLAQGEAVLRSGDGAGAIPLLTRLIDALESRRLMEAALPTELRGLLVRALSARAAASLALGDPAGAEADLGRLLAVDPGARVDAVAYPGLEPPLAALRKRSVGEIALTVDPLDAEVLVDGVPVDARSGPVPALAGGRTLEVLRPGYAPQTVAVDVVAGKSKPVKVTLERTGAVIRLQTRPDGAEVRLDERPIGATAGSSLSATLPGGAAVDPRALFSQELVFADVPLGLHVLEVRKAGFRPYRVEIEVAAAVDYQMPPIVLEEELGRIVLLDLPPGAGVTLDGAAVALEPAARPQLPVRPGEHRLAVAQGTTRMFTTTVRVADRQNVEVRIRLRPGLAFLGVLGGDAATAGDITQTLRLTLERGGRWSLLEGTEGGLAAVASAGVGAEAIRRAAAGQGSDVDWRAVRTAVERRVGGLVYVLAVPSGDLLPSHVDLWVWAAAPGPARPDRLRYALGDPKELDRVHAAFERDVRLRAPALGALVVDSAAAPLPVVADVTPGGPAAAAGLAVGDLVVAVAGVPISDRSGLDERIAAAEIGEPIDLGVQSAAGARALRVELASSPLLLSREDPELLAPIAWASLAQLAERPGEERWVIETDQALLLLRQGEWEEAARRLRAVQAPDAPNGVGRASVDYWLGVALSSGGGAYRESAAQAFGRAAAAEGARLLHADDAWVAPRARARLAALGVR